MIGDDSNNLKVTHSGSIILPSSYKPLHLSNVICVFAMKKILVYVHQLCSSIFFFLF